MEIMDVVLVRSIDCDDGEVDEVPDCETCDIVLETIGKIEEY